MAATDTDELIVLPEAIALPRVAIVTAARNESRHLARLVGGVAAQTHRPVAWVFVDDGSIDGSGDEMRRLGAPLDFVRVAERRTDRRRSFASKAGAVNHGYRLLVESGVEFDLLACVDADVRLPPQYLAVLAQRFAEQPELGIAGGVYSHPVGEQMVVPRTPQHHVPGPAQTFRREVFEQLGGFWSLRDGGVDTAANVAARMNGWTTRSFPSLVVEHGRRMGTGGDRHPMPAAYAAGRQDYDLGLHPLFEVAKVLRWLAREPVVLGALARLAGYVRRALDARPPAVDDEFVAFTRDEQLRRLHLRR